MYTDGTKTDSWTDSIDKTHSVNLPECNTYEWFIEYNPGAGFAAFSNFGPFTLGTGDLKSPFETNSNTAGEDGTYSFRTRVCVKPVDYAS